MTGSKKTKPVAKRKRMKKDAANSSTTPVKSPRVIAFEKSLEDLKDKAVDNKHFWNNFIRALDAEPRDHKVIRGASGVDHKLLGIGVNDKKKRLVLISDTPTAEHAAMMQIDVQASAKDLNVVVARPAAFDLRVPIKTLISMSGSSVIDKHALERFGKITSDGGSDGIQNAFFDVFGQFSEIAIQAFKFTPLSAYSQMLQFLNQLSLIDFSSFNDSDNPQVDLQSFTKIDITERDRELGICPVPLFEFNESQMEVLLSGSRIDDAIQILEGMDIYQYFFPHPDDVGLGLVDRGVVVVKDLENAL